MHNAGVIDAFHALCKIQVLAAAAGFLTASNEEEEIGLMLINLIEDIARKAAEADHG